MLARLARSDDRVLRGRRSKHGRENRPLRRARWCCGHGAQFRHDTGGQELADQGQDALVGPPTAYLFHQESVMERPETVLDVAFYHPLITAGWVDEAPRFFDRVL